MHTHMHGCSTGLELSAHNIACTGQNFRVRSMQLTARSGTSSLGMCACYYQPPDHIYAAVMREVTHVHAVRRRWCAPPMRTWLLGSCRSPVRGLSPAFDCLQQVLQVQLSRIKHVKASD